MFAKQFSEAGGVTSTTSSKKGGRGRGAGSGFGGRSKRGGRGGAIAEDASEAGLFSMDNSYRTHMLFPGRKDEDGGGGDGPRRSSGSPSFMKQMMSGMMGKRPSDPRASNSQELTRYRATPTRASESEFSSDHWSPGHHGGHHESDPYNRGLMVKSVSFHGHRSPPLRPPPAPSYSPTSPLSSSSLLSTSPPTNNMVTSSNNGFIPYHEPFREHDYASYVASGMHFETNIY